MIDKLEDEMLITELIAIILKNDLQKNDTDNLRHEPTICRLIDITSHDFRRRKPLWFTWKDGSKMTVKSWKGFYLGVIENMILERYILPENCPYPDRYGKSRYMINLNDIHKNAKRFTIPEQIAGFHIECHGSSKDLMMNLIHLLNRCGVSLASVEVAFA